MIVRIVALVYVGLLLLLAGCQRGLIYYPSRASEDRATAMARADGMEPWRGNEGSVIGWRQVDALDDAPPLLVFHGNAGQASQRGYLAAVFRPEWRVYVMEYPGYGPRSGRPNESAFYAAASEAFDQLRQTYTGRPLFVGGESLGTGVAAYLAGQYPNDVAGVLLITPFTSLVDVARSHYPIFPISLLMRDRYPSRKHLRSYSGPVAFIVAEHDEVVPARLGRQLYEEYHGPKRLWTQDGRDHNTLDYSPLSHWWVEARDFLTDHKNWTAE